MRVSETGVLVLILVVSGRIYGGERPLESGESFRDVGLRDEVRDEYFLPDVPVPQDSLNVRRVGRGLFEPFGALSVESDTAYVVSQRDLVIYDVSDEAEPSFITSLSLSANTVREIYPSGPYMYITSYSDGFRVLEKSKDYEQVGFYSPGVEMKRSVIEDGRAYIVCDDGLHIVSIADSEHPRLLGKYERDGGIGGVNVVGDTSYVACSTYGLVALDVTDPEDFIELDSLEISNYAYSVAVEGTVAVVAGYKHITVVDVRDPTDFREMGRKELGYSIGVSLVPVLIYDHYAIVSVWGSSNTDGGLHLIDISDPSSMEEVLYYPVDYLTDVSIVPSYIYITNGDGMRVVDFSNPSTPQQVGFVDGDHYVMDVEVRGGYGYCSDGPDGLRVLDISDPSLPREVSIDTSSSVVDVYLEGDYAYLACSTSQLRVLDVSDPTVLEEVSSVWVGNAVAVEVVDSLAYVGSGDGLHVLDVSEIDTLIEVGFLRLNFVKHVAVEGTYAYVACGFDGVKIIDVSVPSEPTYVSTFPTYDMAEDVKVRGDYMYVAAGYAGVSVVDMRDPEHPEELSYSLAGYGNRIDVVEPYLYLAGGSYGLRVLDVSEPDSIYEVGYYGKASMGGICADGEYIYMGTVGAGFYVFEFTPTGIITDDKDTPKIFPMTSTLHQNYPNPFNPQTTISFDVGGEPGTTHEVKLEIYDVRGRHVKTLLEGKMEAGRHSVVWDGRSEEGGFVSSGIYFSTLETEAGRFTRKMTVME